MVARVQARQLGDGHGHAQARVVLCVPLPPSLRSLVVTVVLGRAALTLLALSPPRSAVPIPARPHGDDGLSYVPNPRFSEKGEWRMRREWPKEFR